MLRKYLPVWVAFSIIVGLLVGKQVPEMGALKVAIPFFLFVMLYPMMINLRLEDIGRALADPKLMLVSVAMNFILTPVLGTLWARGLFAHASPYLAVAPIIQIPVMLLFLKMSGRIKSFLDSDREVLRPGSPR